VTAGRVTLRAPEAGDASVLIAGRDEEFRRWLGPGTSDPDPTACILVDGEVVGWVDFDAQRPWLEPGAVNIGYSVFAGHRGRGVAASAVRLLIDWLAAETAHVSATFLIDAENFASQRVALAVGAQEIARWYENGREQIHYAVKISRFRGTTVRN